MSIKDWSEISDGQLSEEVLRERFKFDDGYRFFPNRFEPNLSVVAAIGAERRTYVIDGCCTYRNSQHSFTISAGQFADIPPGEYLFETSDLGVRLVNVFRFPNHS